MSSTDTQPPAGKPSSGGMYDYYLGGNAYLAVDATAAEQVAAKVPEIRDLAHLNRAFLQRATRAMVRAGVRQFIDVGAGLPTQYNTYATAQEITPDAAVVYVDNDPNILERARDLLADASNVTYLTGDLRDPDAILNHPETRALIDFDQPVGYLHTAIWHFISDDSRPYELLHRYLDVVPSGSLLALSHITADGQDPAKVRTIVDTYSGATEQATFRERSKVDKFFNGLEYLPPYEGADPALAFVGEWGAKHPDRMDPSGTWGYAGVARKP